MVQSVYILYHFGLSCHTIRRKSDVGNEEDWKGLKQLTTGWIALVQNSVWELGFLYSSCPERVWGFIQPYVPRILQMKVMLTTLHLYTYFICA
jgi:hypothetical protein